ncbi:hypothetical protein MVEN_01941000 [Mycena venus]|uniref:F-box domain-containing protein n=1 Tax=Mycena venus TaxID=2733690 RepID=A0A8H6XFJ0_9AGAR|nr:hypothetical protein MVEN_01941000 [Mycena venus]
MPEPFTLPLEMVELVIDHLCDDREALQTCSLVSLQWVRATRVHLFRTVTLRNTLSIQTLVELLESPFSTTANAIRGISVEVGMHAHFSFTQYKAENYAPYLMRLGDICRIESLHFVQDSSSFRVYGDNPVSSQIFLPPWSCFKSVQALSFTAVDTSLHLLGFIASFPVLRELEMDRLKQHWRLAESKDDEDTPPPQLRVVRLSRCATDVVLDWLRSENRNTQATCSVLELGGISDHQIASIAKFLHACGPVLWHLSLSLRLSNQDFLPLDLSHNTSLQYIRVEPDLYFEAVPHLLCSLGSASLEQIELVMPGRLARLYPHDLKRWADLDRHLLQSQFSRLSIIVQLHKAIDEEIIRGYLPLCTARGIISYVYKPVLYSGTYFSV